jgi:hypothetical protein
MVQSSTTSHHAAEYAFYIFIFMTNYRNAPRQQYFETLSGISTGSESQTYRTPAVNKNNSRLTIGLHGL